MMQIHLLSILYDLEDEQKVKYLKWIKNFLNKFSSCDFFSHEKKMNHVNKAGREKILLIIIFKLKEISYIYFKIV